MLKQSLVSIIIPTYNRAHLVGETLDSVLAQTYKNWECIIVDDGSTDNTDEVLLSYIKKDSRFKYYKRPDEYQPGGNGARNYGFAVSKGVFINWFDSDDLMHKDFLLKKVSVLEEDLELDFCCCLLAVFQQDINRGIEPIKPVVMKSTNYIEDYLLRGFSFSTNSPLWRRGFLKGKDLFNTDIVKGQEWDFHLRMLTYSPKYKYLEDVLFFVRRGNDGISTNSAISIEAQNSIFTCFNNAFNIVDNNVKKNKIILLRYVFYRQAVNYYKLSVLTNSFKGRLRVIKELGNKILYYSIVAETGIKIKLKIILGMLVLLFTGKGFKYFHFPCFDKRTVKALKF
ncbi:glycosyltransferase [Winogradskyella psychrotolerans]|uniref:glycosyltransferase family 2 protein n=1 Tax=Winogradskyella psychrotolerans TaxID=1344585 RepID=UPI001C0716FD|nr:glycosyltransferase family 2 protein [Winogradskyella psychrotolerans]MBU2919815.1 glycosyltransferase [Winogradskyella psychrotolerans]